jgi:hypothetical protein
MTLILNGTVGVSDVDGSAATPAIRGTDANTGMFFPAADTIAFATSGTEDMRIDSSGNVGIGASSPSAYAGYTTLTVDNATNGGVFDLKKAGVRVGSLTVASGDLVVNSISTNLQMWTNSAERARIDSNGNMMVGTTGASGRLTATSTSTIAIYGTSTGNHAVFGDTGSTGAYGVYGSTANSSYGGTIGYHNGSGVFGILGYAGYGLYTNASISVNGTVYTSDARLKENVISITGALEKLSALNPVSFDWKAASSRGAASDFGLIAQEVETTLPEVVFITNTPPRTPEMTGRVTLEEELGSYKGVDYSRFIPFLIAATKELKAENDALKARVETLENV